MRFLIGFDLFFENLFKPRQRRLTIYSGLNLEEYNLAFKTLLEIRLTFLIDLLGFYFILLYM